MKGRFVNCLLIAVIVAVLSVSVCLILADDNDSAAGKTVTVGDGTYEIVSDHAKLILFTSDVTTKFTVEQKVSDPDSGTTYDVTVIGESSFENRTSLKEVILPDTITNIDSYAFNNCTALEKVTFSSNVSSIAKYAFSGCIALKTVTLPDSVMNLGTGVFEGCTGLKTVDLSDKMSRISNSMFCDCIRLESISLPDMLGEIQDYAFYNCASLKTINVTENSNLYKIGSYSFSRCDSLQSIDQLKKVTTIGDGAFEYCSSLKISTTPAGLHTIGKRAFANCDSIENFEFSQKVQSIGDGVLSDCKSLRIIKVDANNNFYTTYSTMLMTKTYTKIIQCPVGAESISSLQASTTEIGEYAFCGCSSFREINLPSNLAYIGNFAFCGCSSLTTIAIPSKVIGIGDNAFDLCDSLKSITVDSSNTSFTAVDGVLYSKSGDTIIKCPDAIELSTFTVNSKVTQIKDSAFFNCRNISKFVVDPSSTSFSADSEGVLYNFTKDKLISYPCAKEGESYTIGEYVMNIVDYYAFGQSRYLKSIVVNANNTSFISKDGVMFSKMGAEIGDTMYYYPAQKADSEYMIPSSVTHVMKNAFFGCSALTKLVISNENTIFDTDSVSIGTHSQTAHVSISGSSGYVFPAYAFNDYTTDKVEEGSSSFNYTIIIIFAAVIAVVAIGAFIYFRKRHSF